MEKKPIATINYYFLLPFVLWMVVGGFMLLTQTRKDLFMMVNQHYAQGWDDVVLMATKMGQSEVVIPGLLLMALLPTLRSGWYFALAAIANLTPFFTQQILKRIFEAPRPLAYYQHATWIHHLPQWPELLRDSFPSGHSQGAFSFFCFISMVVPRRYQWVGVLCFLLGLWVCYSRLYLAAHFFADTYVGSAIGVIETTYITLSLQQKYPEKFILKSVHSS